MTAPDPGVPAAPSQNLAGLLRRVPPGAHPGLKWRGDMAKKAPTPKPGTAGPRSAGRLQRAIDAAAHKEIRAALEENEGNVTHAAKALGITSRALWKRMATLEIDPNAFRR